MISEKKPTFKRDVLGALHKVIKKKRIGRLPKPSSYSNERQLQMIICLELLEAMNLLDFHIHYLPDIKYQLLVAKNETFILTPSSCKKLLLAISLAFGVNFEHAFNEAFQNRMYACFTGILALRLQKNLERPI